MPGNAVLNPAYWDGVDVFSGQVPNSQIPETLSPKRREYFRCARYLFELIKLIDEGQYTEVRYTAEELAPSSSEMPDGTVLILDTEALTHSPHMSPELLSQVEEISPSVFWPYADYWRAYRDSHLILGQERLGFPEQRAVYMRSLDWGVLTSRKDGTRLVQAFNFYNVFSPRFSDFLDVHATVGFSHPIVLPLPIHETLSVQHGDISAASRLKQVDVVYPAKAGRERAKKKRLGSFALRPGLSAGF